jgi:hypothetical protein
MTKGEDSTSTGSNDSVFGDSCQRGRKYEPKAKGPHHHRFQKLSVFKEYLSIVILLCSKEGESSILKRIYQKPSWTLRGVSLLGGVLFSQRKKHLKQGEKISNLENALRNSIHLPLTICKRTLKRIYKRVCKNKTCGANVVQNVI